MGNGRGSLVRSSSIAVAQGIEIEVTADSPKIRVRDLLTHTAGLVTDHPWGDRVNGGLLLAPTPAPRIQSLSVMRAAP